MYHYVLLSLLIFGGVTIYGCRLEGTRLAMFSLGLQVATLTIFIVQLMMALETYQIQQIDRDRSYYQKYSSHSQSKLNDIDKMFWSNRSLDRLYFEMYMGEPHIEVVRKLVGPIKPTADILKAEHHACQILFQTMADIYLAILEEREGHDDLIEWWTTFGKWMRSPLLQSHWQSLKNEHHPRFQKFMKTICNQPVHP